MASYCKLSQSPIKKDRPIMWMRGRSFFSLNMLVFANDENTLSRLASSHLTVQIQFSHPAGARLLCLFMWLANIKCLGMANCCKRQLLRQERPKRQKGKLAFGVVQKERESERVTGKKVEEIEGFLHIYPITISEVLRDNLLQQLRWTPN